MAKKAKPAPRLLAPADGAAVRMYRIGHGDCFLIAFPGKTAAEPRYVLIDCGYKPGSSKHINTTAKAITDNIRDATGGRLDVAVITHEHQDHVNGISASHFTGIAIDEAWFAWTEDPDDDLANDLRKKWKDKLLGLLAARNRLQAAADVDEVRRVDRFLASELGGEQEAFDGATAGALLAAAGDPANSLNKKSMKLFKDRASKGVKFIRPHEQILTVPGVKNVRVFALGPPRDPALLKKLDPEGGEAFHLAALGGGSAVGYFGLAARAADGDGSPEGPFASRYALPWQEARDDGSPYATFLMHHYGKDGDAPIGAARAAEAPLNADWRRIDRDWLYAAEQLAIDLVDETNNTSLVLAFELGKGGKVLLFAADAQRGNWLSWPSADWKDGGDKVTARDLLSRTVLYKVGHHGSHNATLNGAPEDEHPNLFWMAVGEHAREFTAMITAVRAWADTQDGWDHPQKAIKDALLKRAAGRVFQTDTDFAAMQMPDGGSKADWKSFASRAAGHQLYFDYTIR